MRKVVVTGHGTCEHGAFHGFGICKGESCVILENDHGQIKYFNISNYNISFAIEVKKECNHNWEWSKIGVRLPRKKCKICGFIKS